MKTECTEQNTHKNKNTYLTELKVYKTYSYIYNEKKRTKKLREYEKRKSHINSKLHVMYISSNNVRHPIALIFTTLHYTSLHFTALH